MLGFDYTVRHKVDGKHNGPPVDFSSKKDVQKYFEGWIISDNDKYLVGVVGDIFDHVIKQGFEEGKSERSYQLKRLLEINETQM